MLGTRTVDPGVSALPRRQTNRFEDRSANVLDLAHARRFKSQARRGARTMPIGSGPRSVPLPVRKVFTRRGSLKQTSRIGRPMSAYDDFSIALGGFRLAPL
jgi:hypothetical protein